MKHETTLVQKLAETPISVFPIGRPFFFLTLSQTTKFRLFQTESNADDNFRFDKNGRKFSKWVENTVGNGEIACYKQFLLFPQCFQKSCTADT